MSELDTTTKPSKPTAALKTQLWKAVERFRDKNNIGHPEAIYQCDGVIEQAYEFIAEVVDIVGYKEFKEDE